MFGSGSGFLLNNTKAKIRIEMIHEPKMDQVLPNETGNGSSVASAQSAAEP